MEVRLMKKEGRFVAADHLTHEEMQSIGDGEYFTAEIKRPRNIGHHRKFFALIHVVFEAQERYPTTDHLLDAIKIGIGHYDLVPLAKGKTVIKTRSIAFGNMGQKAFEEFYNRAIAFIITDILPGVDKPDLEQRVLDFIGG